MNNLPPEVSDSMIHGEIDSDSEKHDMSYIDVFVAWKIGLAAYIKTRELSAKFPHDNA